MTEDLLERNHHLALQRIHDDPIRPELDALFRTSDDREVYSLIKDDQVLATVCVAYCKEIPTTVHDLRDYNCSPDDKDSIAVFYTIWANKAGYGKRMLFSTVDYIQSNYFEVTKFMTMSPKTDMAHKFHTRLGAEILSINSQSINYDYSAVVYS